VEGVTTYTVTSTTDPTSNASASPYTLRGAMLLAKDGDTINITTAGTITLTNPLPAITQSITIQGSGVTAIIDGASKYQIFSVAMGTLTLENLQINNGLSKGGDGGPGGGGGAGGGGGGGAGGGGGLHVHCAAAAVIAGNVSFGGNKAEGGKGGNVGAVHGGGGGGGYGCLSSSGRAGNGGSGWNDSGGGGGGSHTAGGNGGTDPSKKNTGPVAGGISNVVLGGGGGGGAGYIANKGTTPQDGASALYPLNPPSGSPSYAGGGYSKAYGSGGGGAGTAEAGGPGNNTAGGFGGDGIASGFDGGFGGGGGGGSGHMTGSGAATVFYGGTGYAGGGGGGSVTGGGGGGGLLGGGGGGGGGSNPSSITFGGSGGFGGGGGGGFKGGGTSFGGGVGGSGGSSSGASGGGGAGMGGAVFIQFNGSLTVQSGLNFLLGNNAAGGLAGTGGVAGTGGGSYGDDFFLRSGGTLTYGNASNETISVNIVSNQGTGGYGGGGLVMNGSATLTLSGSNLYTGSTQINSGILSVSADNNLGAASTPVQINNGATLQTTASFSMSGSRSLSISGNATIDVESLISSTLTLNRGITESGKGALIKTGFGTLTIAPSSSSFPNTYSAGTTIELGTLELKTNGALVSGSSLSLTSGGATFDMSNLGATQTLGDLSGVGFSSIELGGNQLIFGTATPSTTVASSITGSGGSLVKQGSGSVTLSGSNSYTGGTTLAGGTLAITQAFSLGIDGALSVTDNATLQIVNSFALSNPIAIANGKTLTLYNDAADTLSGNISETASSASMTKLGSGVLTLTGTGSYTGGTTIGGGTLSLQTTGQLASTGAVNVLTGAVFDISLITPASQTIGALTGGGSVTLGAKTLIFGNGAAGSFTFSGGVSGSGSIEKTGSGTAIFSGTSTNTYGGTTTISAGTLSLQGQNFTLPSSSIVSISGGATLDISQSPTQMQTIGQLTGSGNVQLGANELIFGTNSVSPATFSGTILDMGGLGSILKQGSDQVIFTGASSFGGGTTVQEGTLSLGPGGSLSAAGEVTVGTGLAVATFDISTGGNQVIGALSGASDGIVNLGGNQLSLGAARPSSTTFAGQILGAGGSILKKGANTLVLSGSSSYSGGTTLQAGTLTIQQNSSLGTGNVSATGNSTLNIDGPFTFALPIAISSGITLSIYTDSTPTISSVISDSGGPGALLKVGSGSLTLTSAETYTGGTTVEEGSLILGVGGALSSTSPVTVGTGSTTSVATFDASLAGSPVTIGDLSGTSLGLVILSDSSPQMLIFGDGSVTPVTFGGTIEGLQGSIKKAGPSVAIFTGSNTYGGSTTIDAGTLSLAGFDPTLPFTTLVDVKAFAVFDIASSLSPTQTIGPLEGDVNSLVTLGEKQLIFGGASPPSTTFSGVIQDTNNKGSILKVGSAEVIFDGANTFGGGTTIQEGTLSLGLGGSLSPTGAVTVGTSQTLAFATFNISTGGNQIIGALAGSSLGTVDLGANQLTFGSSSNVEFDGQIIGTGSIVKAGSGVETFTRAQLYQGGTTIAAGTLKLLGSSASLYNAGSLNLSNAGTVFDISQSMNQTIGDFLGAASTTVHLGPYQLTFGTSNNELFAGSIDGTGLILKKGTGIETFTGVSTFTGGTVIDNGELSLGVGGQLSLTGSVTVGPTVSANVPIFDIGAGSSQIIGDLIGVNTNGEVTLGSNQLTLGSQNSTTFAGVISGSGGSIVKRGTGTFTLTNSNTFTGGAVIQGGTLSPSGSGALYNQGSVTVGTSPITSATFDIHLASGNRTIGDLLGTKTGVVRLGSNQLTFGTANSVTFGGIIIGPGSIVKDGSGSETFTGVSTYQGSTTVANGILRLQGLGALLNSSTVTVNVGAELQLAGFGGLFAGLSGSNFDNSSLTVNGIFDISSGSSQTISNLIGVGVVTLGSNNLTLGTNNASDQVFSGQFSGSGAVIKQGSGVQVFLAPNSYTGGTQILQGTLSLRGGGTLYNQGVVDVESGATFDTSLGPNQTIGKLTGGSGGLVHLGASTLTFGNGTTVSDLFTFPGRIVGAGGGIIKTGFGTAVLTGTNSQVSSTTIAQGILAINGILISPVDVLNGAALIGNGTINGAVTIENGGILKPGDLVGTLSMSSLTLSPSSITVIALKGQTSSSSSAASLVDVQGAAHLDGSLKIFAANGYYPNNMSYTILEGQPVTGTFSPPTYASGSRNLGPINIFYNGGVPNTVTIQFGIIPQPPVISIDCLQNNPNGINLANYLNQFTNDPVLGPIIFSLSELSCWDLNHAMNSISPARNAIGAFVSENAMFLIASTVSCRMSQQRFSMRSLQMSEPAPSLPEKPPKEAYRLLASLEESSSQKASYWNDPRRIEERFSGSEHVVLNEPSERALPYGSSQILAHKEDRTAFWVQGLAQRLSQTAQDDNPAYQAWTGGALVGSDYYGANGLFGGAVCYAHSSVDQSQKVGKNSIDYIAASIYGTVYFVDGYLEFGLAGAANRFQNERFVFFPQFEDVPFSETAKSHYWGGQILPHLAVGYDFNFPLVTLEPYLSLDCATLYQSSFSEHGASPLNMHQESSLSWLVRSEVGLHIYEVWSTSFGDFVFRESVSYVNKAPFWVGYIEANVVGYPSGFSVDSFTENESLFSPAFQILYRGTSGAFGSLSYIGEFQLGSSWYVSNAVLAKLGCYF